MPFLSLGYKPVDLSNKSPLDHCRVKSTTYRTPEPVSVNSTVADRQSASSLSVEDFFFFGMKLTSDLDSQALKRPKSG